MRHHLAGLKQLVHMVQGIVGDPNWTKLASLKVLLQRPPALLPGGGVGGAGHVHPLHPRPVDEEEVEVVRLQLLQDAVNRCLALVIPVVFGAELGGDEEVLSLQAQLWQPLSQAGSDCAVIPVNWAFTHRWDIYMGICDLQTEVAIFTF